jgi:hypothetical protein
MISTKNLLTIDSALSVHLSLIDKVKVFRTRDVLLNDRINGFSPYRRTSINILVCNYQTNNLALAAT